MMRADARYELVHMSVVSGTFATPTATVEMLIDGETHKTAKLGAGPVDAVFSAVKDLTGAKARLVRYHVNAITSGMDAQGEVSVTLEQDSVRVIGHGADPDIIVASGRAYVNAVNRLVQRLEAGRAQLRGI
jgi:2-isopropylmalate synthase